MRSSTSAFSIDSPSRALVLLLLGIAAYFLVLEVFSRELLPLLSPERRRILADTRAAVAVRPTDASGAPTILLVGNSLLARSIDREQLSALLGPQYPITVFPIENTAYVDWLFGLRRLLADGARPSTIALCISAKQLLTDATDGEGFAYLLMRLQDLPEVAAQAHLNLMSESAYFFAYTSAWLGSRANFRDGLMLKWLPGALELAPHLTAGGPPVPLVYSADTERNALARLKALQALAAQYRARFIWLQPPTLVAKDIGPQLATAAAAQGISVLIPTPPASLPHSAFADGFHLNAAGAAQYTPRAAEALRDELGKLPPRKP